MSREWFFIGAVVGFILLLFKTQRIAEVQNLTNFNPSLAPVSSVGPSTSTSAGNSLACCGGSKTMIPVATGAGPGQANNNAPASSGQMFYNTVSSKAFYGYDAVTGAPIYGGRAPGSSQLAYR